MSIPAYILDATFDVKPVHDAILANPGIWNTKTMRTDYEESPHYGLSDIWARFADSSKVDAANAYDNVHESVWQNDVTSLIPIQALADEVLKVFPGKLGGVLITKIKPGKLCKPHVDIGWHAKYYDKIAVSIAANDKQAFCFDDLFLVTKPGEAFWFDNSYSHWVPNISSEDRITAIFCIRPTSKGE